MDGSPPSEAAGGGVAGGRNGTDPAGDRWIRRHLVLSVLPDEILAGADPVDAVEHRILILRIRKR